MKSIKIKLYPDQDQKETLDDISDQHRRIFNHCLGIAKENSNFKEIISGYKNFRNENNLSIPSKSAQNTARMIIESIKSFYKKRKEDKTAHFPHRFKKKGQFVTFIYDSNRQNGKIFGGFKIENGKLILYKRNEEIVSFNLPKYALDRVNEGNIKNVVFTRDLDENYYILLNYQENLPKGNLEGNEFIAIDLGVKNILTAFSSSGEHFQVLNKTFKNLEKQANVLQSRSDQKTKGSRKWKKLRKKFRSIKKKISSKNKDFQHKLSRKIIEDCKEKNISKIAVGDIKTKKCITKYRKGLNKSTQNRGTLSRFKEFLQYKAKSEGIDFQKVNEAYTSQINCITGKRELSSELSVREVELLEGLKVDRDLNSAINIAKRTKGKWLTQTDPSSIKNFLMKGMMKMYMDDNSQLCMKLN